MQCSTPVNQYREEKEESPDMPAILCQYGSGSPLLVDPSIYEEVSGEIVIEGARERKRTNVSDPL